MNMAAHVFTCSMRAAAARDDDDHYTSRDEQLQKEMSVLPAFLSCRANHAAATSYHSCSLLFLLAARKLAFFVIYTISASDMQKQARIPLFCIIHKKIAVSQRVVFQ